jgi:hypothetical protein
MLTLRPQTLRRKPIRNLYYNLTITFVSVVVAVLIDGIETLGLMGDQFALKGAFRYRVDALSGHFTALALPSSASSSRSGSAWSSSIATRAWTKSR